MNGKMKCLMGSAVCLVTMLLQSFADAQISDRISGFPDVPENHWAHQSVGVMAQAGIIEGEPQDRFQGDNAMTRYEFAVAMSRLIYSRGAMPPLESIDTSNFATKAEVNQILDRLTAIENRLSDLEKKTAVAPVVVETGEFSALRSEVKIAVVETSSLIKRVAD